MQILSIWDLSLLRTWSKELNFGCLGKQYIGSSFHNPYLMIENRQMDKSLLSFKPVRNTLMCSSTVLSGQALLHRHCIIRENISVNFPHSQFQTTNVMINVTALNTLSITNNLTSRHPYPVHTDFRG